MVTFNNSISFILLKGLIVGLDAKTVLRANPRAFSPLPCYYGERVGDRGLRRNLTTTSIRAAFAAFAAYSAYCAFGVTTGGCQLTIPTLSAKPPFRDDITDIKIGFVVADFAANADTKCTVKVKNVKKIVTEENPLECSFGKSLSYNRSRNPVSQLQFLQYSQFLANHSHKAAVKTML